MRQRHIFSVIALVVSTSGCTMDPSTEAALERAIREPSQNGAKQTSYQKGQSSGEQMLPEQRAGWCKNEVVGRYDTFQANVSITDESGNKIFWEVDSTGKTGHCVFDKENRFVKIVADRGSDRFKKTGEIYWNDSANRWIAPDGTVCASCTPENGFPIPPKTQDDFFYLPEERAWFDPDGKEYHSCTPENGFPIPAR